MTRSTARTASGRASIVREAYRVGRRGRVPRVLPSREDAARALRTPVPNHMLDSDAKLGAIIFLIVVCLVYGLRGGRDHGTRTSASALAGSAALTHTDQRAPMLLLMDIARRSGPLDAGG